MYNISGLYSKHVPLVPVLVESWSGQVNFGSWLSDQASYRGKNTVKCSTKCYLWNPMELNLLRNGRFDRFALMH